MRQMPRIPISTCKTKDASRPTGVSRLALAWLIGCLLIGSFCIYKAAPGNHTSSRSPYRLKGIAEFKAGDNVVALNHETGEIERRRVVQTFRRTSDHLFILAVRGEDGTTQIIKTTDEHPFWVVGKSEYVEAKDLQIGDRFHGANGKLHALTGTRYEPHPEGIAVYNLEVEGLHNYFVTLNGGRAPPVLAHNADYFPDGVPPVFRGGTDMTIKPGEIKLDKATGLVKSTHGVSVDSVAATVERFGGANRIKTIPDELTIIQRGRRPEHFEIVPKHPMTPERFQELLNQVVFE